MLIFTPFEAQLDSSTGPSSHQHGAHGKQQQQQQGPLSTGPAPLTIKRAATSTSSGAMVRVSRLLSCADSGALTTTSRGSTSKLDNSCNSRRLCPFSGDIIVSLSSSVCSLSTGFFARGDLCPLFHPVQTILSL